MEQIFYNGDIITMEDPYDKPEAVLVRDGVIKAVGAISTLKLLRRKDCVEIDLHGQTLMPAFIDAHGHLNLTTRYTIMADLSSATCFADIVRLLKNFQMQHDLTYGEYIFGYAYDHNFLQEQTHPTKELLDLVSTEVPVVIWHTSIHMAVVNSKALEVLQIDEKTPDPKGGIIERYPNSKIPNGYLEETAINPLYALQANMKIDIEQQLYEAQMKYLSYGITTVQDGEVDYETVGLYRRLAMEKKLLLDVVAYPCFNSGLGVGDVMEKNQDCIRQYKNHYKIGGYKILLDGSPQCKSAWMSKPYETSLTECGYPWLKDELLEKYLQTALEEKQQVLVHCNGDAAADQYLTIYQKLITKEKNYDSEKIRPVMIHCQTVREDQLDIMKKLGMIPSIFVAHVNYWGDVHLKNLGRERGRRVSPVCSAMKRNLIYNFHTDTPVVKPDIFHTIWAAVNRVTRSGIVCGAEQCIDVYSALKAVTIHAAYEYFEENTKGSIKVGKRADLIVLDCNPLKINPMDLQSVQIVQTYKDGVLLYQK